MSDTYQRCRDLSRRVIEIEARGAEGGDALVEAARRAFIRFDEYVVNFVGSAGFAAPERRALYFTVLGEPVLKMLRYQQQFTFFDPERVGDTIRFVNLSEEVLEQDLEHVLERIVQEVEEFLPGIVVVNSFRTVVRAAAAKRATTRSSRWPTASCGSTRRSRGTRSTSRCRPTRHTDGPDPRRPASAGATVTPRAPVKPPCARVSWKSGTRPRSSNLRNQSSHEMRSSDSPPE